MKAPLIRVREEQRTTGKPVRGVLSYVWAKLKSVSVWSESIGTWYSKDTIGVSRWGAIISE